MRTKKSSVKITVLLVVLVILTALLTGMVVMLFRNNGVDITEVFTKNDSETRFYVSYEGNQLSEKSIVTLSSDSLAFGVSGKDYSVKIVANPAADDFYFYLDGERVKLKSVEDYTDAFTIKKTDDGFVVSAPEDFVSFSRSIWRDKVVYCFPGSDLSDENYFLLTVTSGKQSISFPLKVLIDSPVMLPEDEIYVFLSVDEVTL